MDETFIPRIRIGIAVVAIRVRRICPTGRASVTQTTPSQCRNPAPARGMLTGATFGLAYECYVTSEFHRRNIGLTKL
jgi:hypothetical protein